MAQASVRGAEYLSNKTKQFGFKLELTWKSLTHLITYNYNNYNHHKQKYPAAETKSECWREQTFVQSEKKKKFPSPDVVCA